MKKVWIGVEDDENADAYLDDLIEDIKRNVGVVDFELCPMKITKKKKKAMISQPMNGISDEEIKKTREKAVEDLEGLGFEVIDTLFTGYFSEVSNAPLYLLGKSLQFMSKCDTVYFCLGWENARGCKLEHAAAEVYGLNIIEEGVSGL